MMQQFVNRKGELDALRKAFESDRAELVVVYGRRRVGKTALVLKAARLRAGQKVVVQGRRSEGASASLQGPSRAGKGLRRGLPRLRAQGPLWILLRNSSPENTSVYVNASVCA